jgi:putative PIN family toxin of toxin-antitoxin system
VRAVIDTNVWVSAFLSGSGFAARVLDAYLGGGFTLIISEPLLEELVDVLSRPRIARRHGRPPERVAALAAVLREHAVLVPVAGAIQICRDADDNVVIETALDGRADVLVSRDRGAALRQRLPPPTRCSSPHGTPASVLS